MIKLEKVEVNGKTYEAEIGKIESTFLGIEDHGILTFIIHIDFEGSHQGAGTYSLDQYDSKKGKTIGTPHMAAVIRSILETVGVDTWEKLPGKSVVVLRDKPWDTIRGLTNLPPAKPMYTIFEEIFEGK